MLTRVVHIRTDMWTDIRVGMCWVCAMSHSSRRFLQNRRTARLWPMALHMAVGRCRCASLNWISCVYYDCKLVVVTYYLSSHTSHCNAVFGLLPEGSCIFLRLRHISHCIMSFIILSQGISVIATRHSAQGSKCRHWRRGSAWHSGPLFSRTHALGMPLTDVTCVQTCV